MQHFIIYGNLVADPELRYTPQGRPTVNFCVAENRRWKSENGEPHEAVTFVDFKAWAKTAQQIAENFRKGDPILIDDARLENETWEDKATGKRRSRLIAVADHVTYTRARQNDTGGNSNASTTTSGPRYPTNGQRPAAITNTTNNPPRTPAERHFLDDSGKEDQPEGSW